MNLGEYSEFSALAQSLLTCDIAEPRAFTVSGVFSRLSQSEYFGNWRCFRLQEPIAHILQKLMSLWPQAIGYVFATLVAQIFIWPIVDLLWNSVGVPTYERPRHWHSRVLGVVERVMFVASIQIGISEFIGVWMAIKVAGQWKQWSEGRLIPVKDKTIVRKGRKTIVKEKPILIIGREIFNIFLLGNAISIIYSAVGAIMINWFVSGNYFLGVAIPTIVLILSFVLWLVVKKNSESLKENRSF
jgi:hypothetical protein